MIIIIRLVKIVCWGQYISIYINFGVGMAVYIEHQMHAIGTIFIL